MPAWLEDFNQINVFQAMELIYYEHETSESLISRFQTYTRNVIRGDFSKIGELKPLLCCSGANKIDKKFKGGFAHTQAFLLLVHEACVMDISYRDGLPLVIIDRRID